jgi:hypothetical protein
LKDILHNDPGHSATGIKRIINEHPMKYIDNNGGQPAYADWIRKIRKLAESLQEFDDNGFDNATLLELFMQKYLTALPSEKHIYDSIITRYKNEELSWMFLVGELESIDLRSIVVFRTSTAICEATEDSELIKVMYAALNHTRNHDTTVKPVVRDTGKSLHDESLVVLWSETSNCVIHPSINGGRTHTNADCRHQTDIRLKLLQDIFYTLHYKN